MVATGYPNGQKTEVFDFRNPNRKCQLLSDTPRLGHRVRGLKSKMDADLVYQILSHQFGFNRFI